MQRQNITLSISKDILRQARHLAIEKGTSLSGLLAAYLEQMLRDDQAYRRAMTRAKRRIRRGINMGTGGRQSWSREELHER